MRVVAPDAEKASPTAREPFDLPSAWSGPALASDPASWTHRLTPAEIADLDAALATARRASRSLTTLRREDFPLTILGESVRSWAAQLHRGLGFLLVKGFPVERYDSADAALAYYGLGLHLGTPVSQNAQGDLLGHVRDEGLPNPDHPSVRLYRTRKRQDFHTDGADVIGLLCLRAARQGGASRIVSSVSVYNEILRRRPDLVEVLFQPFWFDRNDEQREGEPPAFALPICREENGSLRTFYIGWYIRGAQRHPEVPRLTAAQREVLALVESIANDPAFHLDMHFEPGDIQWLENSVILHAREAYEDWDEPERQRHLLRLWLRAHDFASVEPLLRGGIPKR
jgi:hypothetical protein